MKRYLLVFALFFFVAVPARAELTADQVAIIAMKESPESQELAKHYAKARGISESRILLLEGKPDNE
ncbi:MAG TPA: hypothetical protein VJL29_09165 [Thermoguttaceae bacterium]|nr:hypothetical protein [Thermoguttaceae bacterium]